MSRLEEYVSTLIITPEPPWPVTNGWRGRHFKIIRCMSEFSSCDVATLAPDFDDIDPEETRSHLGVRSFTVTRHTPPSKRITALKSLLTSKPLGSLLHSSEAFHNNVADLSARNQYDTCLVLGDICMAQYARDAQAQVHVLDMCDDLALNYERRALSVANRIGRAYYRRQAQSIRSYLRSISVHFDKILAISEPDAMSLSREVEAPVVTVPNGVDAALFRPEHPGIFVPHEPLLLFVGAMCSWSNRDAIEWFTSSVMPIIVRENPVARLRLVGSGTSQLAIDSHSVDLLGFADDLAAEYRKCDVFVCPLRVGTGIKNKLLEALASGCAIVSTDVGTEGLDVRHDEHLLVANDPLEFAYAVNRLLRDPELRKRLSKAARAFTERSLSTEITRSCLREAMLPTRNLNACSTDL